MKSVELKRALTLYYTKTFIELRITYVKGVLICTIIEKYLICWV